VQKLEQLARLLRKRNSIDNEIAALIGRPALTGHMGEFIAAAIFNIDLEKSATAKALDGRFATGPLAGCGVNIKWYGYRESILDLTDPPSDFYLVLTGPKRVPASSVGTSRPLVIDSIFLFDGPATVDCLKASGCRIGIASSVRRKMWSEAEIYPSPTNTLLIMSEDQKRMIKIFVSVAISEVS